MRARIAWWWSSLLVLGALPLWAQASFTYTNTPLVRVVADVEARTPYRFLYRDALLEGKTVTLRAQAETLPDALSRALFPQGLGVQADPLHGQILLYALRDSTTTLSGYVLDAQTGTRLPFATITWRANGLLRGAIANEAGAFTLALPQAHAPIQLVASFVGYAPRTVWLEKGFSGYIAFRLDPREVWMGETLVTGSLLQTTLDTTLTPHFVTSAAPGLAEKSTLRRLQALPSVGISPAFAPGPTIRGARADGFEVLLDNVSIYAPTHFFGLFDAFNLDALQTVAFYYDVAPAAYFAPPGGTLSYSTRTGSQRQTQATAALTNTALRGTLEIPLAQGRGSALVSGRHSALGAFGWMGNSTLISMGLDIARPTGGLPERATDIEAFTVRPGTAAARFYDAHARLYYEAPRGARWILSSYAGADHTEQHARRFTPVSVTNPQPRTAPENVETRNRWDSQAVSLQQQGPWGSTFVSTVAALSQYHARFEKDDFAFDRDPTRPASLLRGRVDTLGYQNTFREWKLAQQISRPRGAAVTTMAGYSLHLFDVQYEEQSGKQLRFSENAHSTQADLFGEVAYTTHALAARAGLRGHAFAQGRFYRLSPRLRVHLAPQRPLSVALGYSQNHQFLHQLYLENYPSASVWVLSTNSAPPSHARSLSATLYARPRPALSLQVDAYVRATNNLRQHETNSAARAAARAATLTQPWLSDITAQARGVEVLAQVRGKRVSWTNSYTLARTSLQHPALNSGQPFRADWDRTHSVRSELSAAIAQGLSAQVLWLYGTGTPNRLSYEIESESATLGDYHRLDAALRYVRSLSPSTHMEAAFSLYNVYDRDNPWYRETVSVVQQNPRPPRRTFGYYNVDVYDLGITPSFEISVHW